MQRRELLAMSKKDLIKKLKKFKLPITGSKREMVQRLIDQMQKKSNTKQKRQQKQKRVGGRKEIKRQMEEMKKHRKKRAFNPLQATDHMIVINGKKKDHTIVMNPYIENDEANEAKTDTCHAPQCFAMLREIPVPHSKKCKYLKTVQREILNAYNPFTVMIKAYNAFSLCSSNDIKRIEQFNSKFMKAEEFDAFQARRKLKNRGKIVYFMKTTYYDDDEGDDECGIYEENIIRAVSFPRIIGQFSDSLLETDEQKQFQHEMNNFQLKEMSIKNDFRFYGANRGKVHDLINPSKNLSIFANNKHGFMDKAYNYHKWIATRFEVNETECTMSEIPNLDPYRFKAVYNGIKKVFMKMLPLFENTLGVKLNNIPIQCIVKSQDYIIGKEDIYVGGLHKDGLFEDICCVGLYYYQIDESLNGGELELHLQIERSDGCDESGYGVGMERFKVNEGCAIVFDNNLAFHKVSKLFMKDESEKEYGSRKILAFFLLNPEIFVENYPDTTNVVTNWRAHMTEMVGKWLEMELVNGDETGYEWLLDSIDEYLSGTSTFIAEQTEKYVKCRKIYTYQNFLKYKHELEEEGYDEDSLEYGNCNLD